MNSNSKNCKDSQPSNKLTNSQSKNSLSKNTSDLDGANTLNNLTVVDNVNIDNIHINKNNAILDSNDDSDNEIDDGIDDGIDDEVLAAQTDKVTAEHVVSPAQAGLRIDKLAAQVFSQFSRAQLQGWLVDGSLLVDGVAQKPKYRVKAGEQLQLSAQLEQHGEDLPEDIDIDVVYEDEAVLVINKPVGMVVHPGAGNWTGTLVNGLLFHYPHLSHLPRAGLVHRIDKDTSGLLLIAKSKAAQLHLMAQLKDKSVYRHYQCVVAGDADSVGRHRCIDAPIGRHRSMRTKMTVTSQGREAVTHLLKISPLNDNYCLVDVGLETGRTHQIRVHLSHVGHPLVGDGVYGGRRQLRTGLTEQQRQAILAFPRQALHAYALGFVHPESQQSLQVTCPLPEDMIELIAILSN